MPEFTRAVPTEKKKPDARGKVVVKIILQSPSIDDNTLNPVLGNRKEQIVLKDATVGEVYAAIEQALFGGK